MLTNARYSRLKAALTRAKNNNPLAVLLAVEKALDEFDESGWPDGWATWRAALDDAYWAFSHDGLYEGPKGDLVARFHAVADRFVA